MDSYQREKMYQFVQNDKLISFEKWVQNNKILNDQKQIYVDAELLCTVLKNMKYRQSFLLELCQEMQIHDDISIICKYISSFSQFVRKYLMEYQGYISPFSVDCIIAVNDCKRCDDEATPKNIENLKTYDIGNIKDRLTFEKCIWVSDEIEDVTQINEKIAEIFGRFKEKMINTQNCDEYYPTNRRLCIFIDRRKDRFCAPNDEIIMYSPPNNCNIIPKDHIPQSLFAMSDECLVPYKGYNNGETEDPTADLDAKEISRCYSTNSNITTKSPVRGRLS